MKKVLTLLLGVILAIACMPSLSGCKKLNNSTTGEAGTVKRYFWGTPSEQEIAAIKYFEETYGGKVDYTIVQWDQMDLKLLADVSAGSSPDLVYIHGSNFPRVAIQRVLMPLEDIEYEEKNDPILSESAASVRTRYSYGGKTYAIGASVSEAIWCFFNKTMFENAGLPLPTEQFKKGTWNWDTFREAAMTLTGDTTGDGKVDQYGYASWQSDIFVMSNAGKFVEYTSDGNISLVFDQKLQKGLQFMQDAIYKDKYMAPDSGSISRTGFQSGKIAMVAENIYMASTWEANMQDEWDFVPFPLGPDNAEKVQPGAMDAWGISANSNNVRGALLLLKAMQEYKDAHIDEDPNLSLLSEEQKTMFTEYSKNIVTSGYAGIGNWNNKQWAFWDEISAGTPISTVISTYKPVFQAEIDATLKDTEPPKVENFEGVTMIDFEDGDLSWVSNQDETGKTSGTAELIITSDSAEVLDGSKSLKIIREPAPAGEEDWQLAFRTNPDKWKIPSYGHIYKISFDYKMLTDMGTDGFFYITLRGVDDISTGKLSFGWTQVEGRSAGDGGKIEAVINVNEQAENLCVVLGGYNNGDMIIDNLMIEEQ